MVEELKAAHRTPMDRRAEKRLNQAEWILVHPVNAVPVPQPFQFLSAAFWTAAVPANKEHMRPFDRHVAIAGITAIDGFEPDPFGQFARPPP